MNLIISLIIIVAMGGGIAYTESQEKANEKEIVVKVEDSNG